MKYNVDGLIFYSHFSKKEKFDLELVAGWVALLGSAVIVGIICYFDSQFISLL